MRLIIAIWFSTILSGLSLPTDGQRYLKKRNTIEVGGGVNLSYFDVGGGSPGLTLAAGALFDLHPNWRIGPHVALHRTRGTDKGTPNEARGYSYRSNLFEISFRGQYVFRFTPYPAKRWKRKLEPRVFGGLGIVQVQAVQNQPLSGQNSNDGLSVAPLFSGGIGLAWHLERDLSLLLEAGSNLSTSDFLEGYTNLNNSSARDMFHSILLKIIYRLPVNRF